MSREQKVDLVIVLIAAALFIAGSWLLLGEHPRKTVPPAPSCSCIEVQEATQL